MVCNRCLCGQSNFQNVYIGLDSDVWVYCFIIFKCDAGRISKPDQRRYLRRALSRKGKNEWRLFLMALEETNQIDLVNDLKMMEESLKNRQGKLVKFIHFNACWRGSLFWFEKWMMPCTGHNHVLSTQCMVPQHPMNFHLHRQNGICAYLIFFAGECEIELKLQ